MNMYSPLQVREIFHIEFLRWLGRTVKPENYAVKGGVNLRFFFKSFRYSEDMDIDARNMKVFQLQEAVMKILNNRAFQDNLKPFGIARITAPDIAMAKQTETTQRFKAHLILSSGEDLFTKIEFSRRGFAGDVITDLVDDGILRAYKLAPLLAPHYDCYSAAVQKTGALASRAVRRSPILATIKKFNKRIFTTGELSAVSGRSLSAVTQSLNCLARDGIISKIYRGIWAQEGAGAIGSYDIIPYLFPRHRAYVSFISALHLYGIIEQIPQVTTLASTSHGRTINTKTGVFRVHRINPSFFAGFDWYKGSGNFLIAEPEKALVDSLYLSAYKKKYFGYFPELHFSERFSIKKARAWVRKITNRKVRSYVARKLESIFPPAVI